MGWLEGEDSGTRKDHGIEWLISGLCVYRKNSLGTYISGSLTYALFFIYSEVRMAEMASMGVGNKAFWDIAPSEEAISDRNINYVLKRRGSRHPTEGGSEEATGPFITAGLCSLAASGQTGL